MLIGLDKSKLTEISKTTIYSYRHLIDRFLFVWKLLILELKGLIWAENMSQLSEQQGK
jgi:hypothetical protein